MINLDKLLNKEISRREFIGLIGAGIFSIIGASALLKSLSTTLEGKTRSGSDIKGIKDYGDSLYGGKLNR